MTKGLGATMAAIFALIALCDGLNGYSVQRGGGRSLRHMWGYDMGWLADGIRGIWILKVIV